MAPTTTTSFLLVAGTILTMIQPCPAPLLVPAIAGAVTAASGAVAAAGTVAVAGGIIAGQVKAKRSGGSTLPPTDSDVLITFDEGRMVVEGLGPRYADMVEKWNSYPDIAALEAAYGKVAVSPSGTITTWDYPEAAAEFAWWGLTDGAPLPPALADPAALAAPAPPAGPGAGGPSPAGPRFGPGPN